MGFSPSYPGYPPAAVAGLLQVPANTTRIGKFATGVYIPKATLSALGSRRSGPGTPVRVTPVVQFFHDIFGYRRN